MSGDPTGEGDDDVPYPAHLVAQRVEDAQSVETGDEDAGKAHPGRITTKVTHLTRRGGNVRSYQDVY